MRVHIGTDHAAFETKEYLVEKLREAGFEVIDHGAYSYDAEDDYPLYIIPTAQAVVDDEGSLGIVLGGSGNGEQVAANKVKGAFAILATNVELAQVARQHNNANILSMGGRFVDNDSAFEIARTFLATEFSNQQRHIRRLEQVATFEQTGTLPQD